MFKNLAFLKRGKMLKIVSQTGQKSLVVSQKS